MNACPERVQREIGNFLRWKSGIGPSHTKSVAKSIDPDFGEVIAKLIETTWKAVPNREGPARAIARAEQTLVVHRLIELAENDAASPEVRAAVSEALNEIWISTKLWTGGDANGDVAHRNAIRGEVLRFINRPGTISRRTPTTPAPPGDPIGGVPR